MATSTVTAHSALHALLKTLVIANEICLPFHQWIITSSKPADDRVAQMMPSPILPAMAYAIAEPLCTKFLIWLSVMPWSIAMSVSPSYLMTCEFAFIAIAKILNDAVREAREKKQPKPGERVLIENPWQVSMENLLWLTLPLGSAAFLDAGLLLQAQSVAAPIMQSGWYLYLGWFGASLYILCSGFAGFLLSERLWKPLGPRTSTWTTSVLALVVIFTIKQSLRRVLGLDPWLPFVTLSGEEGEAAWGEQRYQWIFESVAKMPWWLPPGLSLMSVVSSFASVWFMNRAAKDGQDEE